MPKEVYVVTGFDLGWDNVVGIYTGVSYEELLARYPENEYYIQSLPLETAINE